ncbi:hypothetical protein [Sphingobium sp. BS19]|uniref:hypothetical protein n=1 Tax=Sphingobium sp. BS19 TaxID=3018973 RepID=UPI0022EF2D0E|nr:hypothetical protein [Sphingobium sp. BS19]GLI99439.1 hypothetical protein Sbs19_32570 [Sphingobium sp. BS19]
MKARSDPAKRDVLWKRYWSIKDDHGCGLFTPILWHLALGKDFGAMATLAGTFDYAGRMCDQFSQAGLLYRADQGGYEYAAQHLAMSAFNRGDLASYRRWLRRTAKYDPDCLKQLKRFETRLPHRTAREIGRGRPYRKYD